MAADRAAIERGQARRRVGAAALASRCDDGEENIHLASRYTQLRIVGLRCTCAAGEPKKDTAIVLVFVFLQAMRRSDETKRAGGESEDRSER
jgi:hypothetical protein